MGTAGSCCLPNTLSLQVSFWLWLPWGWFSISSKCDVTLTGLTAMCCLPSVSRRGSECCDAEWMKVCAASVFCIRQQRCLFKNNDVKGRWDRSSLNCEQFCFHLCIFHQDACREPFRAHSTPTSFWSETCTSAQQPHTQMLRCSAALE